VTGGPIQSGRQAVDRLDAIVIGAGFGGIYMLYRLRQLGFKAVVLEMGDGVGGTWYWNRYPGARVDVEALEYSYSFSQEIEDEWEWTEVMPTQPELERYLNFVVDRLDLRRDIRFGARVTAATYDDTAFDWTVETEDGLALVTRYVIAATGCLSAPLMPNFEGRESFAGVTLFTNQFPRDGFDFTGKQVGVIGTGSSGVQTIPIVAEQAQHLYVFQRSAAFTRPANNRMIPPDELRRLKAEYPNLRRRQLESFAGTLHFGGAAVEPIPADVRILDAPMVERFNKVDQLGWNAPWAWADVYEDFDANRAGVELYAELIRRTVNHPEVAESLVPKYPLGCKRPILDTGYFEAFNRDNVTLVDLHKGDITAITETGVLTEQGHFPLDVIVYATGFDAITGSLNRIDVRGRDGRALRDTWDSGPRSLLGLQIAGFPNLFTLTGPGSPSVHVNMVMAVEQHVDWIGDCLTYMRDGGVRAIEATEEAQEAWVGHVASLVDGTIRASDACNSWYLGANVPGKPRVFMTFVGGLPAYRQKCDEVAAAGYKGFLLLR
jgi:cation diffusion facilitator CzcD-associated flavoprotein CzcO